MFGAFRYRQSIFRSLLHGATMLVLLGLLATPLAVGAQEQTCTDCIVYAAMDLNLRQDPSESSEALRTIPAGAELSVSSDEEVDGYIPVTYDSVPGWVATQGLASPAKSVGGASETASTAVDAPPSPTVVDETQRITLAPLMLRSGPAEDAEPILVMPEGALVSLTGEGVENGYITVDYDGEPGWAFADLLSEVSPQS
jgi:uncharacterized protein YraI